MPGFGPCLDIHPEVTTVFLSEDYLQRSPASELHFATGETIRSNAVFLMIPFESTVDSLPGCKKERRDGRTAVRFSIGSRAFTLSFGTGTSRMLDIETDAELVVLEHANVDTKSCLLISGSFVRYGATTLFSSESVVDFADVRRQDGRIVVETSEEKPVILSRENTTEYVHLKNLAD